MIDDQNKEGLTFGDWIAFAGGGELLDKNDNPTRAAYRHEWRAAWKANEDPSDWRGVVGAAGAKALRRKVDAKDRMDKARRERDLDRSLKTLMRRAEAGA